MYCLQNNLQHKLTIFNIQIVAFRKFCIYKIRTYRNSSIYHPTSRFPCPNPIDLTASEKLWKKTLCTLTHRLTESSSLPDFPTFDPRFWQRGKNVALIMPQREWTSFPPPQHESPHKQENCFSFYYSGKSFAPCHSFVFFLQFVKSQPTVLRARIKRRTFGTNFGSCCQFLRNARGSDLLTGKMVFGIFLQGC